VPAEGDHIEHKLACDVAGKLDDFIHNICNMALYGAAFPNAIEMAALI